MTEQPSKRRKLLKIQSQKYYSRKSKIEQALLSLQPKEQCEDLPSLQIPSSVFLHCPILPDHKEIIENTSVHKGQEMISYPVDHKGFCVSSTKLETVYLPTQLTQITQQGVSSLTRNLTLEIWNSLPVTARSDLLQYLPVFNERNEEELHKTLELLFSGSNFNFGNPIQQFLTQLADKQYQPQKRMEIHQNNILKQYSHIQKVKERNYKLLSKTMDLKRTLHLPESNSYLLIPPKRHQQSSKHLCNEDYLECSDTDGDSAVEDKLSRKSKTNLQENLVAVIGRKEPDDVEDIQEIGKGSLLGKRKRGKSTPSNRSLKTLLFAGDSNVVPSGPVWIFFNAVREFFIGNNFEITLQQLEEEFNKDEEKKSVLCPPYTLHEFLELGLYFLQNPPSKNDDKKKGKSLSKNSTPTQPDITSLRPPSIENTATSIESILNPVTDESATAASERTAASSNYQPGGPFVRKDSNSEIWRWIGAIDENVIKEELENLELLFYFAITRNHVTELENIIQFVPTKQQKCTPTIRDSTEEERESYQKQEKERYEVPEKPFRYYFRDDSCVVAPMKRGPGSQSQKARDHFLLHKDRPPHISLLCLVRDAAARLPGGIGTRPDVAILLKDSQFIVQDVSDSKLNTVVSGALDRLHAQADPCVRFDGDQKMWIYLHRRRTESNFPVFKTPKKKSRK